MYLLIINNVRVIYLPSTKNDFVWLHEYYSSVFPDGWDKALKQLDMTAELLSLNPYIWKEIEKWVRDLVISSTPFSYIYRITDSYIEVLRVWDNRQDSLV